MWALYNIIGNLSNYEVNGRPRERYKKILIQLSEYNNFTWEYKRLAEFSAT